MSDDKWKKTNDLIHIAKDHLNLRAEIKHLFSSEIIIRQKHFTNVDNSTDWMWPIGIGVIIIAVAHIIKYLKL